MARIYESIKSLIGSGHIATAAATLGQTEREVSAAVGIILPSLLARTLKKGDTPQIRDIVEESRKMKLFQDYRRIWEGSGVIDGRNMGERMKNQLLGPEKSQQFLAAVSAHAGMKKEHTDRLTDWVAGTMAAWFAEKAESGHHYADMLGDLADEKAELRRDIPARVVDELGLASTLGLQAAAKTAAEPQKRASEPQKKAAEPQKKAAAPQKKKSSWEWLLWLALIVLILLIFLWWRSCDRKEKAAEEVVVAEQVVTVPQQPVKPATPAPKESTRTLDGKSVTVYEDATADNLKAYLDSDKFKNATAEQLKSVWFEFKDIDFEHNSAVEMMAGAEKQVQALALLIKNNYPGVQIKVGAFADRTGTHAVNFAISKKRAENIKAAFVKAGIDAKLVSVEGFGDGYAKVDKSATDAQRAPDRDIALRFAK